MLAATLRTNNCSFHKVMNEYRCILASVVVQQIIWPRLFCTALFRARPGQLLVLRIYKEGSHENRPEKVALVVLSTIYVSDENFL